MKEAKIDLQIYSLFLTALLFTGCAKMTWEEASETNTLSSYRKYIRQNPDSEYAVQARSKIVASSIYSISS